METKRDPNRTRYVGAQVERESCGRCGREWEFRADGQPVEVSNAASAAPCAGCGGGQYVAPRPVRRALSLDCPTCGRVRALSRYEAVRGYQCRACADLVEGVG